MWARWVRHRAETAATCATRGWCGLTCRHVLSVGGTRAERELGGEAKQAERSGAFGPCAGKRGGGPTGLLAGPNGEKGETGWAEPVSWVGLGC